MIDETHRISVYDELKRQIQEHPADDKTLHMSQLTARQLFSDDHDRYFTITKDGKYAHFCGVPITWTFVESTAIRLYARDALIYSIVWNPNPDKKMLSDAINPDHYKKGGMEVIDILKMKLTEEEYQGFLKGNVIKYTMRAGMKNGAEDLKKAAWYSSMLAGKDPREKPIT